MLKKSPKSFKSIEKKCNKCTNRRKDSYGRTVIHWCANVDVAATLKLQKTKRTEMVSKISLPFSPRTKHPMRSFQ